MPRCSSIVEAVGNTPLVCLERLGARHGVDLKGKIEGQNPSGSVKDRIARAMIDDAERSGRLLPGATLIEPTSGNTGIALAMIAAARGFRLILTMPEAMSAERVSLLRAYGADIVLTRGTLMQTAVEQAELLGETTKGSVLLRQFENPANPRAHRETTGEEIWRDSAGEIDVFVAGVGTGGTISGVGGLLKERRPEIRVVAVEPEGAAVLSGASPKGHRIQGIGAGFVPKVLDRDVIDEVVVVNEEQALAATRELARTEGVLAGFSSGAALAAALSLAKRAELGGKRFVVMMPDSGERYASTTLFRGISG